MPIIGAVQRKGNVVAKVVASIDQKTLYNFVHEAVSQRVSLLCTDQWASYKVLGLDYPHGSVNHKRRQYVVGAIHTNTIEGFWSLVKRGIGGVYHSVSRKHLLGYLNEYVWRYNQRLEPRGRFEALLLRSTLL